MNLKDLLAHLTRAVAANPELAYAPVIVTDKNGDFEHVLDGVMILDRAEAAAQLDPEVYRGLQEDWVDVPGVIGF